ncbi:TonB-dependent receptor [Pontibacter chitinilyticus]|uniref:TonB-dependent receptor n=1 Tax=Pontibacter chitinilyticus TaxID=2674989 RepID=UPI00321B1EA7
MKRFILLLLLVTGISQLAHAQKTLTGKVLDATTKEALQGVTLRLLHTKTGTITGPGGSFILPSAAAADTLLVSYIGYTSRRLLVSEAPTLIQLQPAPSQLNQVIVSANREQQARAEAPVAISVISKQTILDTKAVTLDQLLNKVSGVYMVDLGNEQHTMAIRLPIGYSSLFLYLEDGIPIRTTGDFNHNALIEINMAALKTIEVVRGPASSLYGSEAIGGAINFITQAPAQVFTAHLAAEAGSGGYRRTDFSASNTYGKLGIYAGGYYAAQRNGLIAHSDFDKLALTLRADYVFSPQSKLVTSATLIDYNTDQTGGLDSTHFYRKAYGSLQTFTYRKVQALRLRSTLVHTWNNANSTQATLFFRANTISQNPFYAIANSKTNPLAAKGEINADGFHSYGLIAQHRKTFPFLNAQLIGGISMDYSPATYQANFIAINRNDAGVYTSYTRSDSLLTAYTVQLLNTAAYAQAELTPLPNLKAVAAFRYDRLDYTFDNKLAPSAFTGAPDEQNGFKSISPKLGLTYDFGRNTGTYVNYSVGFAPPQISELYRGVKVPTLQPSHYTNYEAGGWVSFDQSRGYVDVSVYQLNGTDEIISVRQDDGTYQEQNAGSTRHRGIEYTLKYAPSESIALRFSGTNARHWFTNYVEQGTDYAHNQMATAPRFISNAEVTFKPAFAKGMRLSLEWQHLGAYYMDAANTEKYGGYDLLNARAGYSWRGVEVWLNTTNLTNQLYATTVDKYSYGKSYRQGNPRTATAGIGYNFAGRQR